MPQIKIKKWDDDREITLDTNDWEVSTEGGKVTYTAKTDSADASIPIPGSGNPTQDHNDMKTGSKLIFDGNKVHVVPK